MYKVVAVDMDGTLLNQEHKLSDYSKEVLLKLKKRGVKIILASGRPYPSLLKFAKELDLKTPLIANNGALVKSPGGEIFTYKFITERKAEQLLKYAQNENLYTTFYFPDYLCVEEITEETSLHLEVEEVRPREVGDLTKVVSEKPIAIHFKVNRQKIKKVVDDLKQKFGTQLAVMQSAEEHIDILHKDASKGLGLAEILKEEKINSKKVIAFGNSYNDLAMLEVAGCGIAVANSPKEVKRKADKVTLSNEEDGVAKTLEKVILEEEV